MNAQLIEQIVTAARRPLDQIAERRLLKGSDGKWYSPRGIPMGVKCTGETSAPYYVRMSHDGTTYGKRFDSAEALRADIQAHSDRRDEEFRAELEKMNDTDLQRQAAYWLKTATAS